MYLTILPVLWLSGSALAGEFCFQLNEQRTQVFSIIGVRFSEAKDVSVLFERKKTRYDSLIHDSASRHRVDANLVKAIIYVESNFNPWAVSPKGCMGLMQLHPDTAVRFGVRNIFDPTENIEGGVQFLSYLMQKFNGDLEFVLAGYNAGEQAVARYNGVPPYRETQKYVIKVTSLYRAMGHSTSEHEVAQPFAQRTHSTIVTILVSAVSRVSQRVSGFHIWIIILAVLILRAKTRLSDAVLVLGGAILIMVLG